MTPGEGVGSKEEVVVKVFLHDECLSSAYLKQNVRLILGEKVKAAL